MILAAPYPAYGWMMLAGILVSIVFWSRLAKRDDRLLAVYVAALAGAFLGAKLVYLFAEGWADIGRPDMWLRLATGKSILGGLLGGYAAVEIAKKLVGYRGVTGDWFAVIVPVGILFGRVGCLLHGCCLGQACQPAWYTLADREGVARWPAVPVELAFNAVALVVLLALRQRRLFPGQLFHLYLMAYGLFRMGHEIKRDTLRMFGPITGYQIAAAAVFALGIIGYRLRAGQRPAMPPVHNISPPPVSK